MKNKEESYIREIGNLKESFIHCSSTDFDQLKLILEVYESNRVRLENTNLLYDNSRHRR
jgi:hypothetical protein